MPFARRMMSSTSLMPGKMGEMKQVVRTPARWNSSIARSRRSMETARSMSSLKPSSSVFTDQDTRAPGKLFMSSRSRSTRSLLVAMLSFIPLPCSCSSSALVRPYSASCGR